MRELKRRSVDWFKTGKNLQLLRNDNINLRRNVCRVIRHGNGDCDDDCDKCKYEMDSNISRAELARVFNVSESVIFNWESGKTPVGIEDLLFYCEVANVNLTDIIVYE